jgi:hypothetical protein
MIKKIDLPESRDILWRMGIVEPVFANICFQKKLNYFILRTKKKVNIQWLFYCIIHNPEKITKYGNLLKYEYKKILKISFPAVSL